MIRFTGHQLAAARALLGLSQQALADAIGMPKRTLANLEIQGDQPVNAFASTIEKVTDGLRGLGVEFTNGREPGVKRVG